MNTTPFLADHSRDQIEVVESSKLDVDRAEWDCGDFVPVMDPYCQSGAQAFLSDDFLDIRRLRRGPG